MPTINLPKRKERSDYKRYAVPSKRNNLNHIAVYNTLTWKILRLEYMKDNPLCEMCIKKDKIKSAVDIHHIIPISSGVDMIGKKTLGFDINNLMAVCKECHFEIHKFSY